MRARVAVTLALSLYQRGERTAAQTLLDEADALLRDVPPSSVHVLAAIQRAGMHGRSGEWDTATRLLESLDIAAPDVSPRARCVVHLNLGLSYQFLGRYADSDARLRRAHQDAVAFGLPGSRGGRGAQPWTLADAPRQPAEGSRPHGRGPAIGGDLLPPGAILDRARVLSEAGLIESALTTLMEASHAARIGRIAHDLAETDLELARLALLRDDLAEADRRARRAELGFSRAGEDAWVVWASLLRLQAELLRGRRLPEVAASLSQLADGAAVTSGVGAEAAVLAAEANARVNRPKAARRLARAAGRPPYRIVPASPAAQPRARRGLHRRRAPRPRAA